MSTETDKDRITLDLMEDRVKIDEELRQAIRKSRKNRHANEEETVHSTILSAHRTVRQSMDEIVSKMITNVPSPEVVLNQDDNMEPFDKLYQWMPWCCWDDDSRLFRWRFAGNYSQNL